MFGAEKRLRDKLYKALVSKADELIKQSQKANAPVHSGARALALLDMADVLKNLGDEE